jgi:hypothetical protein
MRKIIAFVLLAAPAVAFAAPDYAGGSRVGMVTGRAGATARPTVPVTTTTTTTITVPETNITNTNTSVAQVEIDAERTKCLSQFGNIWADKIHASPDGVPATYGLSEAANVEDNVCYSMVSVRSSEIQNMGRFFQPRYFKTGSAVECGKWLNKSEVDDAILDAKKTSRYVGTTLGVLGGAAAGVGLTELIGQTFFKQGFMGQAGLESESTELLKSQLTTLKREDGEAWRKYAEAVDNWRKECDSLKDKKSSYEECKNVDEIDNLVKSI